VNIKFHGNLQKIKIMTWSRLKHDPITKKQLKPIFKFNNGRGAVLCRKCGIIIKENLGFKELIDRTDLLFCSKCALDMIMKIFKKDNNDEK